MQTLYGVRITDRVQVVETAAGYFIASFDGEVAYTSTTGRGAVNGAIEWLKARALRREFEAECKIEEQKRNQFNEDEEFLYSLSDRWGVGKSDLDTLIEIINRRKSDND